MVFLPSLYGDIQITPMSPASMFNEMKGVVAAPFFKKKPKEGQPAVAYGKWHDQEISSQPQNISGMIYGARKRFLGIMPSAMSRYDAEVLRFAMGGDFPTLRDTDISDRILAYVKLLGTHQDVYSNMTIRRALDWHADGLINEVSTFVEDVFASIARIMSSQGKEIPANLRRAVPDASDILFDRRWKQEEIGLVRLALTSTHFNIRQNSQAGSFS
jgi:hypothetical protein